MQLRQLFSYQFLQLFNFGEQSRVPRKVHISQPFLSHDVWETEFLVNWKFFSNLRTLSQSRDDSKGNVLHAFAEPDLGVAGVVAHKQSLWLFHYGF